MIVNENQIVVLIQYHTYMYYYFFYILRYIIKLMHKVSCEADRTHFHFSFLPSS